jgi:hypothetical protein
MNISDIAHIRLNNQQITVTDFKTPKEIMAWMGAIQAQDNNMCKWAIGARSPNSTDATIQRLIDSGEILRTHVLRPTWHLVSRDDIYWILELTAPQIKAAMRSNDKRLELTEAIFAKSNKLIETALTGNKYLTREELMAGFKEAGIVTNENRASHLLLRAEADGLICSGTKKAKHQTYTLLQELIPKPSPLTKDEALAKLARAYFLSRSPATLKDFVWWSGLSVTDARQALEMIKHDFVSETIGTQTYWLSDSFTMPDGNKPSVYLLPSFDEFLIAYADRSAAIASKHQPHAFSNNGIFRPVIVVNGQVTGTWKRTIKKGAVSIETNFFFPANQQTKKLVQKAALAYGDFIEKEVI